MTGTPDLFWFTAGVDANDAAVWLVNNSLNVHLLGYGFREAAD